MPSVKSERGVGEVSFICRDAPTSGRHLDWLRCAELLSDADCDEMIRVCQEFPTVPTARAAPENPQHAGAAAVPRSDEPNWPRRRKIGLKPETQWIFDLLGKVAVQATGAAYELDLTQMSFAPQYLEYLPGVGEFNWHSDYSHGLADAPRKLTIIIQLSDPGDYDGGRLQMFGLEIEDLPATRGTIVAFPAFLYHRVTPVTRGLRRALVAWVGGPRLR